MRCVKVGTTCNWDPIKRQNNVWSPLRQPQLLPKSLGTAPSSTSTIQKRTVLLPKINILAPLLANPSKSLFNSEEEHRYFAIFSSKTAFEILPSFDSGTLRQILLQACVTEPSIRHAVLALGALDKTAESLEDFGSLPCVSEANDPARHHQNALKQYTTAIGHMRVAALRNKQDIRTTLVRYSANSPDTLLIEEQVTCLVIFCFEAWDGLKENAVQQIHTGLSLIQDWREENEARFQEPTSKFSSDIEEDLVRAFSRLDVQAISFAFRESRSPECQSIVTKKERDLLDRMPAVFSSVQDAEVYESAIIRRTMRFLSFDVPLPKLPRPLLMFPVNGWYGERSSHVVAIQQSLLGDILRWQAAFKPLWKRLKSKDDPSLMIGAMLQMHQTSAFMALTQICIEDEEKFDDYNGVWEEIVNLAEYSLNVLQAAKSSTPKFQFDSHIVIPLHMVGHKCRDRAIRRRAISLLLSYPRREGVWDSTLAGGMSEWAMNVEEAYLENGRVPGCK